jgi:DNA-binding NarL/FixJ family response regulator
VSRISEPIRVLIVDDHAMVRRGMRDFLDLHDDLVVVGEAANGLAALEMVATLLPDVVVMDLLMPGLDGIAATAQVKARYPSVEVVAITSFIEDERIAAAIEAGASGFLLKDAEADDLATAIRAAHQGEVYLDPAVAGIVTRRLRHDARGAGRGRGRGRGRPTDGQGPAFVTAGTSGLDTLTAREAEVLAGVARGLSNRAIADELGITERTARTHVSNILAKLGLTSRTQAALLAVEQRRDIAP